MKATSPSKHTRFWEAIEALSHEAHAEQPGSQNLRTANHPTVSNQIQ